MIGPRPHRRRVLWPLGAVAAIGLIGLVLSWSNVRLMGLKIGLDHIPYLLTSWVGRALGYRGGVFEALTYPFPDGIVSDLYHVLALLLVMVGLVEWFRRSRVNYALVFFGVYVAAMVLAPLVATSRYLLPVVPFILFGFVNGIRSLLTRVTESVPLRGNVAAAVAVVLGMLAIGRSVALPIKPSLDDDSSVLQLVEHIRQREEPMRLVFFRPRYLSWKTRQAAMPIPLTSDPQLALDEFDAQGISHVVTSGLVQDVDELEDMLKGVVQFRPERFVAEYRAGAVTLYRFVPGGT